MLEGGRTQCFRLVIFFSRLCFRFVLRFYAFLSSYYFPPFLPRKQNENRKEQQGKKKKKTTEEISPQHVATMKLRLTVNTKGTLRPFVAI